MLGLLQVILAVFGSVAAAVGLVFGYQALTPDTATPDTAVTPSSVTTNPAADTIASATSVPAASSQPATRYLTDLPLLTGTAYLKRPPNTKGVLVLHCPTGQSDDRDRAISFDLAGAYRTLGAVADLSGPIRPERPTDVVVNGDDVARASGRLTSGRHQRLDGDLSGVRILTIRIRCGDPNGVVTIRDALLQLA